MGETWLILGDCLDVLRTLEPGSVDAVVTDPPYGQSNETYDRGVGPEVWRECFRVAKPNAALLSFAGGPTYHRIASGIEAGGWRVRQMWAWVYRDGVVTSAYPREGFDRLAPAMDPICFATKGEVLLNCEREGDGEWNRPGRHFCGMSDRSTGRNGVMAGKGHRPRAVVSDGTPPFEYFAMPRASWKKGDVRTGHPNQKPIALMHWLLNKLPPGGTVLDPFAGSGTTLVATLQTGRGAIGIEVSPEYAAIAEKRIAAARHESPLFAETP